MAETEFISAWQGSSERVTDDAIALWRRLNILPKEVTPEARASELLYGAYINGDLASVATVELFVNNNLEGRKFALTRYLTAPEFREKDLFTQGALFGHNWLQAWSKENPEADLSGSMWTWTSKDEIYARKAPPYFPRHKEDRDLWPRCILTGWTGSGVGIWTWWFDHIRV